MRMGGEHGELGGLPTQRNIVVVEEWVGLFLFFGSYQCVMWTVKNVEHFQFWGAWALVRSTIVTVTVLLFPPSSFLRLSNIHTHYR